MPDLDNFDYKDKICPVCGKKFIMYSSQWVYKRFYIDAELVFCSWKCLRAWEKDHEGRKERNERILREHMKWVEEKEKEWAI